MKIRSIIIDDEEGARESLGNIIKNYFPEVEVLAKGDSVKDGLELILSHQPDLVFLDIEMPGGNAFNLLTSPRFGNKISFEVIFITAFDHYAIQAIKFSALDYLLKPIDVDDLRLAIQRYQSKRNEKQEFSQKIEVLLHNLKFNKSDETRKIAVADMQGLTFINLIEIIRCESDGNYTLINIEGGKKILSSKPLSEYDEMFSGENFFRIHRSHLINLKHIKKYFRGEGGYVLMSDNSQIEVSRRKKNEFMEKVGM